MNVLLASMVQVSVDDIEGNDMVTLPAEVIADVPATVPEEVLSLL
jgi:hypothetical protein